LLNLYHQNFVLVVVCRF